MMDKKKNTEEQLEKILDEIKDTDLAITGGLVDEDGNIIHLSLWSKKIHISSRISDEEKRCQKQNK
jgi:hypothetical protein